MIALFDTPPTEMRVAIDPKVEEFVKTIPKEDPFDFLTQQQTVELDKSAHSTLRKQTK